jgi:hypothetical protein
MEVKFSWTYSYLESTGVLYAGFNFPHPAGGQVEMAAFVLRTTTVRGIIRRSVARFYETNPI